ncbi:hypothetical protein [Psychroserpens jangbogonensis]|uniref:hypothetical protein n=1 Tax=Psychroserpens jangbogonensis TaxID=1484460 RepID=UPI00126A6FE3|nr:hypothetical protein [Psychroserpens jangbogonensis]
MRLITKLLEHQVNHDYDIDTILIDKNFDDDNNEDEVDLLNIEKLMNYLTLNKTHSKTVLKKIYTQTKQAMDLYYEIENLPVKNIEKEFWYYDNKTKEVEPSPTSDFIRVKNFTHFYTINPFSDKSFSITSYFDTKYCGFCEHNSVTKENIRIIEKSAYRNNCNCKKKYIESLNFRRISLIKLITQVDVLMSWLLFTYPKFEKSKNKPPHANKDKQLSNSTSKDSNSNEISEQTQKLIWFKLGLHFAKDEVLPLVKEGLSKSKIAIKLGNSSYKPYLLSSLSQNYASNQDKNIFNKDYDKVAKIVKYCNDNKIEICTSFTEMSNLQ